MLHKDELLLIFFYEAISRAISIKQSSNKKQTKDERKVVEEQHQKQSAVEGN